MIAKNVGDPFREITAAKMTVERGGRVLLDNRDKLAKGSGSLLRKRSIQPKYELGGLGNRNIDVFRHVTGMRREPGSQTDTSRRAFCFGGKRQRDCLSDGQASK